MIAIARIGRDDGRARALFAEHLDAPSQEIAETAAVCFGILKEPEALAAVLPALLFDEPAGREMAGGEVPLRTRAFAAYAVGLIGGAGDAAVQELAAEHLLRALRSDRSAAVDVRVAAVLGLGLLGPDDPALSARLADALLQHLAEGRDDELVLAHLPTTVAKLLRDHPAGDAARERGLEQMLRLAQPRVEVGGWVRQSAVMALGMLARDLDPRSGEIFAALRTMADKARDPQARNFTAVSIAYLAAADPHFDAAERGAPATSFLLQGLRRSGSGYEAWSALGLGVLGFLRREAGAELAPLAYDALLDKFERARAPDLLGACAIGLGLARHSGAAAAIAAKMDRVEAAKFRGHAALALGLLGARSVEPLIALLQEPRRPALARALAASALGCWPTRSGCPGTRRSAPISTIGQRSAP